ncbi:MAG: hypothetical protein IT380_20175 [Myxococcales bacterium]|nr:hypothetical protein [Myxococcales bacterium]
MRPSLIACALAALIAFIACSAGTPSGTGGGGGASGGGAAGGGGGGGGGTGGGGGGTGGGGGGANGPTWYKDVLPIARAQCQSCHSAGGIAPFALETYAQAKPMAAAMANAVAQRRMPPWMPDPSCGGPFVGERLLTQAQIDTVVQWNQTGAAEGNPSDAPPPPDGGVVGLPQVDATLIMPQPYTPSAALTDDYRCFLVDPQLASAKQVVGYDIQPGVRAEVHHVIIYLVNRTDAVAEDAKDSTPGWQCFGGAEVSTSGALGAWAPGSGAVIYPAGTGIRVGTNQVLAMQVHYNTQAGVRVPDQTSVKLQYAAGSVTNAYLLPLVADGFDIPPQSIGYSFTDSFTNPVPLSLKVWGLLPHMHQLGKRITIRGANDECLVDIPRWDFHWQQQYFRPTPHTVGASQALTMRCEWDNPGMTNVTWGEGTTDEMCFAFIYATP